MRPGWDLGPFPPDDLVRLNFSHSAHELSDHLVVLSVAAPVLVQLSNGFDTAFGNSMLIYAETYAANQLAGTIVRAIVRRPRPYTHAIDPRIQEFADGQGDDAYLSFYSGHASTSHAAATSGAILYSARTNELWARHVFWGVEYALAGATAQLRVRAGRNYRTDILAGGIIGIGIGTLVPALHGVELSRVRSTEVLVGGGALALTYVATELIDFCDLLDLVGLCELPRDVRVPVQPSSDTRTETFSWAVLPAAFEAGGGLQAIGSF